MASVWRSKLSAVSDAALELFLLVGADKEELRGGISGRVIPRPLEFVALEPEMEDIESDVVSFFRRGGSQEPVLPSGAVVGRRVDP